MKKSAVDRSGQKDRTRAGFIERMETVARTNLRSFEETQRMVEVGIALVTMVQRLSGLSIKRWRRRRQRFHG